MSEITIAVPTHNCSLYVRYVLDRLTHQKIPNLPVIAMDNGSTDGTIGLLSEIAGRNFYHKKSQEKNALQFRFFMGMHNPKDHPYVNAMKTRKAIAELVKTPYVFFLDPDVLIKPLILPRLLDEMKETGAPYVGLKYEPDTLDHANNKHLMLGATLWKLDKFLKVPEFKNEDLKNGCDCLHCFRSVKGGLHSRLNGAEHLKNVMI